uniref:Ubiquitin-like domain-containing protein n=1 Tax=Anopheles farauti TaxID=69004 RepID=A0A1Y9H9M3_9DIPT
MLPFLDETDELFDYWILRALVLIVIYLAWRSTYVREDRQNAAVLVIEGNLGRLNSIQPQSVTTIILRSSSQQSNISNVTETEELDLENDSIASSIDNITQSILTEASESATGLDLSDTEGYPGVVGAPDTFHDPGPEEIIRQMDATEPESGAAMPAHSSTITSNLRQRSNVNRDNDESSRNEHSSDHVEDSTGNPNASCSSLVDPPTPRKPIRIKLKYLNDDSKLVEGNLNEGIGEFKRRNFTLELAAHKLVRLVFNGHVLQPDTKTLAACGLFDNCVVHCLIHNQKSALNGVGTDRPLESTTEETHSGGGIGNAGSGIEGNGIDTDGATDRRGADVDNNGRSGTRYGTYFIYIGTLAVTIVILYGWYCRFHYGHLFNLNSTIGLIVTTTTFLIMMPTIILADSNTPN